MAKVKKRIQKQKENNSSGLAGFDFDELLPKKFQNFFAIIIILLVFLVYFSPMYFGNKTLQSGDIVTIKSMQSYTQSDKSGFTLWNPYIFCGIPAYVTGTAYRWWDSIGGIYSYGKHLFSLLFSVEYAMNTLNLILISIAMFFFMRYKKAPILLSLLVSLATAFSTGIVVFLYIGHITKMISLAAFPLLFMMLLRFNEKIRLLDFLVTIAFMHLLVLGGHVQIIFYIFLSIVLFYIFYFIKSFLEKNKYLAKQLLRSVGVIIVAGIIGILLSFDTYAQLWEYKNYSTRGTESILEKSNKQTAKEESDFYQYATNWSFSPEEVLTFIVPSFYGFGNSTYKGPLSQNQPVKVNTYFGQMPFVDVAMYMGVVIFFLGIFGIFTNWEKPFVKYLTFLIIFCILLSFGRNFSIIYDIFYYYFPFFNKFRVPSMVLTIVQMSMPILAGFGLMKIISLKREQDIKIINLIRKSAIVFSVLFILFILLNSALKDWFISRVQESGQRGQQLKPIYDYMSEMFIKDLIINMALVALTFGTALAYIKGSFSRDSMILCVAAFALFDLFRIDLRGLDYSESSSIKDLFNTPAYISAIKNDKDNSNYRIINFKKEGLGSVSQNSNFNVYFLQQDFSGYSAAKPRTYQDLIDVAGYFNLTLFRMLNVKYIVFDETVNIPGLVQIYNQDKTVVYKNISALPRAYLVDSVATRTSLEILNAIKNNKFDPKQIAYLEKENVKVDRPDSTTNSKIQIYEDEYIKITVNASGNNFLFLGDTYYPNGWKAFVDGKETKIYKTNHGFRGILVSKGIHTVEFKYLPVSFVVGKYISLILNVIIIGLFALLIFAPSKRKDNDENI